MPAPHTPARDTVATLLQRVSYMEKASHTVAEYAADLAASDEIQRVLRVSGTLATCPRILRAARCCPINYESLAAYWRREGRTQREVPLHGTDLHVDFTRAQHAVAVLLHNPATTFLPAPVAPLAELVSTVRAGKEVSPAARDLATLCCEVATTLTRTLANLALHADGSASDVPKGYPYTTADYRQARDVKLLTPYTDGITTYDLDPHMACAYATTQAFACLTTLTHVWDTLAKDVVAPVTLLCTALSDDTFTDDEDRIAYRAAVDVYMTALYECVFSRVDYLLMDWFTGGNAGAYYQLRALPDTYRESFRACGITPAYTDMRDEDPITTALR